MNAAARFDESASATGSSMRPRGLFDGPFRAGPAQARPARAGRVGGTTGRDSRHGPALSSGRASPALMISCWAVFWAPVFGPCSGWPSWARPIFPALARAKPLQPLLTPCACLHAVGLNHSLFEDGSHTRTRKATIRFQSATIFPSLIRILWKCNYISIKKIHVLESRPDMA